MRATLGSTQVYRRIILRFGASPRAPAASGAFASSDHGEDTASPASAHPSGDVELTRRAHQIELDKRLQTVQQEIMVLASDVSNGEKGARHRSVHRLRASMNRGITGNDGQEKKMSMSDMCEHMRRMRAQIAFLPNQQRSAWAQGLSDDPPPGYTPEISS